MRSRYRLSESLILFAALLTPNLGAQTKVDIRLKVTAPDGMPIEQASKGSDLELRAYVSDLRLESPIPGSFGVFAAFMDVVYADDLVEITGEPEFAAPYVVGSRSTRTPGLIDEIGAVSQSINPLQNNLDYLLFTLPFTTTDFGSATFQTDPAEDLPFGQVLVYGEDEAVPPELIGYGGVTLRIVPEPNGICFYGLMLTGLILKLRRRSF